MVSAGVYWNHRSHLDAGVKCEICHGPVAQMANVTNVTTMPGCVDCHQQKEGRHRLRVPSCGQIIPAPAREVLF
jgi:hypothetical protein